MELFETLQGVILLILLWIIPYAAGMMFHHLISNNRLKAIGWLLVALFGLYKGVIPTLVLVGYVFIIPSIYKIIWAITFIGMLGQLVFWWFIWRKYRRRGEISGWRTAAIGAFLVILLVPTYFFLLPGFWCALILTTILGLVWYKDRSRGELSGWHTVGNMAFYVSIVITALMTFMYLNLTTRELRMEAENQRYLSSVGYKPYPGIDENAGINMTRCEGFTGGAGGQINISFRTPDEPEQVLSFYQKCAEDAGLLVHRGTYGPGELPFLVAIGDNREAMKIERFRDDRWLIIVYWDPPDYILEEFDYSYDWE
jgi:hypothetical protein